MTNHESSGQNRRPLIVGIGVWGLLFVLLLWTYPKKDAFPAHASDHAIATPTQAAWSPEDPNELAPTRPFDDEFLEKVRQAASLERFQQLAGSRGKITGRDERPTATYAWNYTRPDGWHDGAVLTVFPDGSYGGSIHTRETGDIVVTSSGMFICDGCRPPVYVCGNKPPWIADGESWRDSHCTD